MNPAGRRRIRVLLHTASLGGVRRHVRDIVEQIDHDRFELIGAFPDRLLDRAYLPDESEGYRTMFSGAGLAVHTLETPPGLDLPGCARAVWAMARLLRQVRPDVLHCHSSLAGAVGRLASLSWRPRVVAYTSHLIYFLRHQGLKRALYLGLERALLPLCDRLIAVSPSEYDGIVQAFGADPRVVRINNAIPRDLAIPVSESALEPPANLALPPGRCVLLSTTRFDSQKDVGTLVRAAALLARERRDFVLLLAGEGPQRAELEAMCRARGIEEEVRFLGWRTDVRALLAACDVLVLSSHMEGLPYSLLEAMALCRPVVGSDAPGVRDCVEHGSTGYLFPVGDETWLAARLRQLIDSPRQRRMMGEAGRALALQRFAPSDMIGTLQAIYQQGAPTHA
ncbi:glycosyltransferase family 4 protein [Fundidesulfovibrio agrisoli]|uniref:glycosyltransferase family 4 protein n=1 Tax=Fundidesulfovibrio agrisoli TaxID=2922717 RepID=UPI001FAD53BE|nr:glycosyltransferase family 4 protein [Fundidesulfovibrio agrisoli]